MITVYDIRGVDETSRITIDKQLHEQAKKKSFGFIIVLVLLVGGIG